MPSIEKTLRECCRVNTTGDGFVGIKSDTNGIMIYLPIGYQLPDNDDELRVDIHNLFSILATYMKEDKVIKQSNVNDSEIDDFPINSYLKVIRHFLQTGRYYVETESHYKTDNKGKISWSRTIRDQKSFIQKNGSMIFTNMTVRSITPNANKCITQIHRYCVYEAFDKLGFLYVPYMPENPGPHPSIKESLYVLAEKIASTYNDMEQELFTAMRDILLYIDKHSDENFYFFGTNKFDNIWERMIDKAFGIENKEEYFPRTRWFLDCGINKKKKPLQPDSIMIYKDKYYVLDAKYYRYGWTGDPNHLPNGTDINKQITYGEYIEKTKGIPNQRLFNAFIMPYNKTDNIFGLKDDIGNIGEAIGEWRYDNNNPNIKNYERIQGIVIDTRYLMHNYNCISEQHKQELAKCIEKVLSRGAIHLS